MSSYTSDAAEQVVRISLEGTQAGLKLAGAAAKQVAVLLYAILKDQKRTKGRERLAGMLHSGKELKVFAVRDGDLAQWCKQAKQYGILYCVLKDRDASDGLTDIMVRAEDAGKVNRIFERYGFASTNRADVEPDKVISQESREANERFMDEFLASEAYEDKSQNPIAARTENRDPSERISGHADAEDGRYERTADSRRSVRKELDEIKSARKEVRNAGKTEPQYAKHKMPNRKKAKRRER